jgi:hypothetical protein
MTLRERRALRKLAQDPDRWWQADMQRKEWTWFAIRRVAWSAIITCTVVTLGIYYQTHGGN